MKKIASTCRAGLLLFFILPLTAMAENVYIDDKVMVGLHQDKDIDSTIIKLLPSGTALEVLKRDTAFTQVKEPGGASGWVDNRYLVDAAPGRAQAVQLQEKISKLEAELAALKAGKNTTPASDTDNQKLAALGKENEELKQQLQSEQLKVGELQAQAAELRNKLSQETTGEQNASDATTGNTEIDPLSRLGLGAGDSGWRAILIGIAVCIIIGLIGGAFLMDWNNRRRHGGFRV
jgi:SH3 domain protein